MSSHGVLILHKPAGMTSHDCVARVRRLFETKKAGHAGTLDPEVTGVLPVCVGQATRIVEYLQDLPKAYEAVMRLGTATSTEDATGEVVAWAAVNPAEVIPERVRSVFARFVGDIRQVPPMYSAVKVGGKRLYELARDGVEVEREARTVTIYDLNLHRVEQTDGGVDVSFFCRCSKGTYIRTLCVDLGKALGYPAHMARLVRVESGPFRLEQAVPLAALEARREQGGDLGSLLVPIGDALSFLPRCDIPPERKKAVLSGLETALPGVREREGSLIRLYADEQFLGVHRVLYGPRGPYAKAEKVFPS